MQPDSNALTANHFDNQSNLKKNYRLQTEHRHSSESIDSFDKSDNQNGLIRFTQLDWRSRPAFNGNDNHRGHGKDICHLNGEKYQLKL